MNDWKELMLGQVSPRYARALTRHEPILLGEGFDETQILLTADQVLLTGKQYKALLFDAMLIIERDTPRRVQEAKRALKERLSVVEARVDADPSLPSGFQEAKTRWLKRIPHVMRLVREHWTAERRRLQALARCINENTRYLLTRHEVEELTVPRDLVVGAVGAVGVGQLADELSPWDPPATPGDALP